MDIDLLIKTSGIFKFLAESEDIRPRELASNYMSD
jgi:hypothetical protein